MKILGCPDLHLTEKRPQNRMDDYEAAVINKLTFILTTAKENGCALILQPGDFFDQPNPTYRFFTQVVFTLNGYMSSNAMLCTIFGQHDLKFRTKENTALNALFYAYEGLKLVNYMPHLEDNIAVVGCSWEEEIPEPIPGKFNILLIHRMIVDDKLWADQEHFEYANGFLREHKFDLIVSGDNHKPFIAHSRGRYLFNCGSMMRSTIAQVDHEPRIIIFDTENPKDYQEILIPIEPSESVFKMEKVEMEKERNTNLEAFVSGLSEHKDMGLNFGGNLQAYVIENKLDNEIYELLKRGMA